MGQRGYYTVGLKRGNPEPAGTSSTESRRLRASNPASSWRQMGPGRSSTSTTTVNQFELLEEARLYSPECVLVVPRTSASETFFRRYLGVGCRRPTA